MSTSSDSLETSAAIHERQNNLVSVPALNPPNEIPPKSITEVPIQPPFDISAREILPPKFLPKPPSPPRLQSHPSEIFDKSFHERDAEFIAKQGLPLRPPLESPNFQKRYEGLDAGPRPHSFEQERRSPVMHFTKYDAAGHLRPYHKHYDQHGQEITEMSAIDQRIKEARLNSSSHDAPPFPIRIKSHPGDRPFSDGQHTHRPRSPPPRNSFHPDDNPPVRPPVRRRSANQILDMELAMMENERRIEDEIIREAIFLDEVDRMAPPFRPRGPRLRPPPPHAHPRPHFSPFRGMRPRMRF